VAIRPVGQIGCGSADGGGGDLLPELFLESLTISSLLEGL
jgi:hypothetical protein